MIIFIHVNVFRCNRTFSRVAFIVLTVIIVALVILAVVLPLVLAQSVTITAAPTTGNKNTVDQRFPTVFELEN